MDDEAKEIAFLQSELKRLSSRIKMAEELMGHAHDIREYAEQDYDKVWKKYTALVPQ